jgi:hypothetical protein
LLAPLSDTANDGSLILKDILTRLMELEINNKELHKSNKKLKMRISDLQYQFESMDAILQTTMAAILRVKNLKSCSFRYWSKQTGLNLQLLGLENLEGQH